MEKEQEKEFFSSLAVQHFEHGHLQPASFLKEFSTDIWCGESCKKQHENHSGCSSLSSLNFLDVDSVPAIWQMAPNSTKHLESPCWLWSAGAEGMKTGLFGDLFYPSTTGLFFHLWLFHWRGGGGRKFVQSIATLYDVWDLVALYEFQSNLVLKPGAVVEWVVLGIMTCKGGSWGGQSGWAVLMSATLSTAWGLWNLGQEPAQAPKHIQAGRGGEKPSKMKVKVLQLGV